MQYNALRVYDIFQRLLKVLYEDFINLIYDSIMIKLVSHFTVCKEGRVLFNNAVNTFYLRLYGVGYMVKDHPDSKRGNLLPLHGVQQGFFLYAPSHRQDSTIMVHWLEREIAQWVHHEGSIRRRIAP